MKIMSKLNAIIAATAMCMTTVSSSVSAKTLYLSDEGDYNENLTEEIVTEDEIPVEEALPEEAVPAEEMPEEVPQVPAQEEVPSDEPSADVKGDKEPDVTVEGIPVYFEYEGKGTFSVTGEVNPVSHYVTLTVIAKPAENYSLELGASYRPYGESELPYWHDKKDFSIMYIESEDKTPITIHANFIFVGTYYPITISSNESHGAVRVFANSVEADKAYAGQIITVNAQQIESGYRVTDFHVFRSDGSEVSSRVEERYGKNYFEFTMPDDSVTVNLIYTKMSLYNINVKVGNNIFDYRIKDLGGNDVRQAIADDHVLIACTPDFEYRSNLVQEIVNAETGEKLANGPTYVMPAADINVSMYVRHYIKVVQDDRIESVKFIINGSEDSVALHDEEVTVIAKPINNYGVGTIIATDLAGNELEVNQENGTFTMPDRDVTILIKPKVSFTDENGELHYQEEFKYISDVQEGMGYGLSDGWYVLDKDATFNEHRMTITGDVNLILCDGATLNVGHGIRVGTQYGSGNTLTIWAQKEGTGKIECKDVEDDNAAIGGNEDETAGAINIRGGVIDVVGGNDGAGIDGGDRGNGGTIYISGGHTKSYGKTDGHHSWGAGIGGGNHGNGGNITIAGGIIEAGGGVGESGSGAAIGGGGEGSGGTIIIEGGTIQAISDDANNDSAGIGGGKGADGGRILISGGDITAQGGASGGAGIGGGDNGSGGNITINGGTVSVSGGGVGSHGGAGIGGGDDGSGGNITIRGGSINTKGGFGGAGIGGGDDGNGGTITIHGGTINASGGHWHDTGYFCTEDRSGSGIGGGDDGDSGNITIYGGTINATATFVDGWFDDIWGAAIGAGDDGSVNNIQIEGVEYNKRYDALANKQDLVLKAQ